MASINQICNENSISQPTGLLYSVLEKIRKILEIQQLKADIRRERQQLRNLTAMQLHDIGISRNDALTEAKRHNLPTERVAFICQRRQS